MYSDIKLGMSIGHIIIDSIMIADIRATLKCNYDKILSTGLKTKSSLSLKTLIEKKCYITYDYNSQHILLFLLKYKNNNLTLFIYNDIIVFVSYNFSEELYIDKGTLFKGIFNNNYYIITDICIPAPINIKLKRINHIIKNLFKAMPGIDTHYIKLTDYVSSNYIYSLCTNYADSCDYIKNLSIENLLIVNLNDTVSILNIKDCIISYTKFLTQNIKNYVSINNSLIDIKSIISMKMYKTEKPDIYLLYYIDVYIGIADVPSLEISAFIKSIFPPLYIFINVKCVFITKNGRWRPIIPDSI